jgi:hypothetical protein
MLTFEKARRVADVWVDAVYDGQAVIMPELTLAKPYGWVFFYQSKAFVQSGEMTHVLVGNAPILLERVNGELRVFGTAKPIDSYMAEYEATIPQARLLMEPERADTI